MFINLDHDQEFISDSQRDQDQRIGTNKSDMEPWLLRFHAWAQAERHFRAAVAYEPASKVHPLSVEPADLHLLVLLAEADDYLAAARPAENPGKPPATWDEMIANGRALDEIRLTVGDGIEVHLAFIPVCAAHRMLVETGIPPMVARVLRNSQELWFDKDGLLKAMIALAGSP
jgi:hypothetical protein